MFLNIEKGEAYLLLIKEVISEIFKISLITYLIFYLIENFKIGFITDYFNINIILYIIILSGVTTILFKKQKKEKEVRKIKKRDYIFIILLGIISAITIYYKIKEIGRLSYIISIVSAIIIIILSILLLKDKEENDQGSED